MQVKEGVEFVVTLTDRPGSLAQLIKKLTATGVSIEAFLSYTSYIINIPKVPRAAGICKLLVDNVEKASDALKELDVMFWEEKVLLVRVPANSTPSFSAGFIPPRKTITPERS